MENLDNDEEEEEEEVIVYANFEEGTVDKEIIQHSDLKFKIIGLDSDTPIVQLGDTTFKGVWNDTIGTKVLFEEDTSPSEPVDPVFTVVPPKMLKYKCMSTKTLELSRIFLKTKNSESAISSDNCEKADGQVNHNEKSEHEVLELIHKTVTPDANTDAVMKDILEQSTMEILNADEESDKNN